MDWGGVCVCGRKGEGGAGAPPSHGAARKGGVLVVPRSSALVLITVINDRRNLGTARS